MMHHYIGTKEVEAWPQDKLIDPPQEGYAVKYSDGYISWSPKETFSKAYRLAEGFAQCLTFGDALHFLKQGRPVRRAGWNGKGLWVQMQRPDARSRMTLPYLYLNYPPDAQNTPNARVPWLASQTDMLAEDWMVL